MEQTAEEKVWRLKGTMKVFDTIPVNELEFEDFRILTMARKEYRHDVPSINV